jgi:RNA polymerase sigma-70 factor (ECF subfamily)
MINLQSAPQNQKSGKVSGVEAIEEHRDYLFYNALGRLRNREAAEDAVQDSFLAALAGANKFSGNASQRTWLTAILKHKVCDRVRRACRDRAVFETAPLTDHEEFNSHSSFDCLCRGDDPSRELQRKELGDAIQSALAKLPHRLAKVFSLYESEDWSGREICAALNISENNLWIMLHRARKHLREELSPWYRAAA